MNKPGCSFQHAGVETGATRETKVKDCNSQDEISQESLVSHPFAWSRENE